MAKILKQTLSLLHKLNALSCDAGVLLSLFGAIRMSLKNGEDVPRMVEFDLEHVVRIEYDPSIKPLFRIFVDDCLRGFAVLFEDGVGRLFLSGAPESSVKVLSNLCTPCTCRAGHLLVARLRYSGVLPCICENSLLKSIFDSALKRGTCPFTYYSKVPFLVVQEYAIECAKQRLRISKARWPNNCIS